MEKGRLRLYSHMFVKNDENLKRIRQFLREGLDPNITNSYGDTLLHSAAASSKVNIRIVGELLDAGADVNRTNSLGLTPLHYAVANRKAQMVDALLQSGAYINASTRLMRRALHYAIDNSTSELFRLQEATVPHTPDRLIIRMLLDHDHIDINARDKDGETPLVWAVYEKDKAIVKALLARGADPNIGTTYGESPLHIALDGREPCVPIVNLLLAHGADLHKLNRVNQTPIDMVVDGVRDQQSEDFAILFFKRVALHYNLNKKTVKEVCRDPDLGASLSKCRTEVKWLRRHIISGKLNIHDFILGCYNENQFHDPCLNIYKPLIDILMTKLYSAYSTDILSRIEKIKLWEVLKHIVSLRRKAGRIGLIETIVFNCNLCRYLSRRKLYELIESCSNLSDDKIDEITSFKFKKGT